MDVKQEPVDSYEETVIIKQETVFINPENIIKVEEHDWASQISPMGAVPNLTQEPQVEALLESSLNDISEVTASEYFVNTNDIVSIKRENPEFDVNVGELLTAQCDLPTLKSETIDYYNQPCSSKQAQELSRQKKNVRKKVRKIKRKRKYPCPICRKSLLSKSAKKKHVSLHFKTFVICQHCGQYFNQEKLFAAHYFVHITKGGEVGQYKCEICCKRFTTNLHLQTHVLVHVPYGDRCPHCYKHFSTGVELHYHLKVHAKRFQCIMCAKKCVTMQLLENHLRVHLRKYKPFICDYCCKDLRTRNRLKRHLMCHTKRSLLVPHSKLRQNNFQCKICTVILSSKKYLEIHLSRHTGENKFECEVCSKKFSIKYDLQIHQTIHYQCNICSKVFKTEDVLKVHLKNHQGVKPNSSNPRVFTCHLCPKGVDTYKSPSAYTKHMDKHSIVTTVALKCEICSIRFKRQEVYDKHLEVNRLDEPFYCRKCSEYFSLKCHELIHCKKQPAIKCIYCQRVFNCRSSLALHSIEHERAFQEANNAKSFL